MGDGFGRPGARRRHSVLLAGSGALTLLVSACSGTPAASPAAQATVAAVATQSAASSVGPVDGQLAATKFAALGTAGELDDSGQHPNPATYKTTFPTTADRIWILYELDDGVVDTVLFDWRKDGSQLATNSFDYTDQTSFAWGWLTPDPSTGKFVPGNYEVTASLKSSGEKITLKFVVE